MYATADHIILFLTLFLIFFLVTRVGQKKINNNYWAVLLVPIIAYTFVVGLRYGWGGDYLRYQDLYESVSFGGEYDLGYDAMQSFLHSLGLNKFWMASLVYAFLFILAVMLVVKNVDGSSKYMIMLFLPATVIDGNTYAIRQYLAISFVLFAFYILSKEGRSNKVWKYSLCILLVIISFFIHGGSLAFTIPLALMYFVFRRPLNTISAVILYLAIILFSSIFIDYIDLFLDKYAGYMVVTDHLHGYVDNISDHLNDDKAEMFGHAGIYLIFEYVSRVILIIISGWALSKKENKLVGVFYNFMIFGLCMQQLLFTSEVFRRIASPIYAFYFIPVGYALYILYSESKNSFKTRGLVGLQILSFILLVYIYYPFYKFIFYFQAAGFIWDK